MMKPYFSVRIADRLILAVLWYPDPDAGPVVPPGWIAKGTELVEHSAAGTFTREGRRETESAYLQGGAVVWVETATLAEARANAWSAVKAARDEAEAAHFEFEGSWYQPDVKNITGAVLASLLAAARGMSFVRDWTLADNSVLSLTGEQVQALGLVLTDRIDAIHQRSRTLRDLIDNATTPAEAYGYTWNSLDG